MKYDVFVKHTLYKHARCLNIWRNKKIKKTTANTKMYSVHRIIIIALYPFEHNQFIYYSIMWKWETLFAVCVHALENKPFILFIFIMSFNNDYNGDFLAVNTLIFFKH
jgi:hypothetical protein